MQKVLYQAFEQISGIFKLEKKQHSYKLNQYAKFYTYSLIIFFIGLCFT